MRFDELQNIGQRIAFQVFRTRKVKTVTFNLLALLIIAASLSFMSSANIQSNFKETPKDSVDQVVNEYPNFDFNFSIQDLSGNKIPFDQFKGKVIFLNIWATWCGPCRAEMPAIQKLYEKMDREKVIFVMLSIDKDSDKRKVTDYVKRMNFTFPPYMPSGYLPEQLRVSLIPTTFIIAKDGKIVKKEVGKTKYDKPKYQEFLEELSLQSN